MNAHALGILEFSRLLAHVAGRAASSPGAAAVRALVHQAAKDDYRFESVVLGIVSSDAFRKREASNRSVASVK